MVGEMRAREIGFTSLHERLDTTTPGGRLIFHVFAALAEFIRELIVSGTREGLAAARARGNIGGRPVVATPEIIQAARTLLPNPEQSITSIAKLLGVSPGTLKNHIPDCRSCARPVAPRAPPRAKAAHGDPRTGPHEGRRPAARRGGARPARTVRHLGRGG